MALSFSVFPFCLTESLPLDLCRKYLNVNQFRRSGIGFEIISATLLLHGGAPPWITVVSTFGFSGSLLTYVAVNILLPIAALADGLIIRDQFSVQLLLTAAEAGECRLQLARRPCI